MKKPFKSKLLFIAVMAMVPHLASADVWQERELLERWIAQTESLYEIIDAAEYSADEQRRSQMNYSQLRKEINATVIKVKHYLNAPTVPFETYKEEQVNIQKNQEQPEQPKQQMLPPEKMGK